MFSHLSSAISEQPQGQKGPWLMVYALSSCHLFLKSTGFSVTVVCCTFFRENKHQRCGFVYTQWGQCLGLQRLHILYLV